MTNILTEYSLAYLPICILVGFIYSSILYTKKSTPWNTPTNWILAGIRFVVVTGICFLLLNPFIRQIKNTFEKPVVVFAIDNSTSIASGIDSATQRNILEQFDQVTKDLKTKGFDTEIQTLNQLKTPTKHTDLRFDASITNLNQLFQNIRNKYENRNLANIVLLSDGIYNQGSSPLYTAYNVPILTLGIGDTTQKKDINLKNIYHNKITYLGNKFPILAEIYQYGFQQQKVKLTLSQRGKILGEQIVELGKNNFPVEVKFLLEATQKGMQHFTITAQPLKGEYSTTNNRKEIYVDVLDGREKILLVAATPHPDIKAMKTAIEKNKNYEFIVHIPSLKSKNIYQADEKYDVVIFHQIPHVKGIGNDIYEKIRRRNTPRLYVLGEGSNLSNLNQNSQIIKILQSGKQKDKVTASFNKAFQKFTFDTDKQTRIAHFPPINVPFGNYAVFGNSEVVLFQQVGNVQTKKPLLVVREHDDKKIAIMAGDGLWRWRLQEFTENENQDAFDELILRLIQYLSIKEDKRKFRIHTTENEYLDSETVLFETEVYNNIYEKIYGHKINLTLTNEEGKKQNYTYTNLNEGFRYKINGLTEGVYKFTGTTELNGKTVVSAGEFMVKSVQLESLNTVANFNLLRKLAQQAGGKFFTSNQIKELKSTLNTQKIKSVIHSSEESESVIHLKGLFFLLISLLSIEWFIRKFRGNY